MSVVLHIGLMKRISENEIIGKVCVLEPFTDETRHVCTMAGRQSIDLPSATGNAILNR